MVREYEGITREFVEKLGKEILDSKIDKNDVPFIEKPLDEFLESFSYNGKKGKIAKNITRSIAEHLNEVGPANWFFKVKGIITESGQAFRILMNEKEVWRLKV